MNAPSAISLGLRIVAADPNGRLQLARRWLLAVLLLIAVMVMAYLAIRTFGRAFRRLVFRHPRRRTPTVDAWSRHKLDNADDSEENAPE